MNSMISQSKKRRTGTLSESLFAIGLSLICLMCSLYISPAYAAAPEQVTLTVRQDFDSAGLTAPLGETFTYWLIPTVASNPMPAGSSADHYVFSITGSDTADIGPLTFPAPGKYVYKLSCINSAADEYHYDRQVYTIEINVYSDDDAIIIIKNDKGDKVAEMLFEHKYGPGLRDPDVMVDPPVQKTVTGNPATDVIFTFTLTPEHPSYPMPADSVGGVKTLQIVGSGSKDFGTWSYTEEGTYRYTVREVNTSIPGYTYDTEVYTITDNVNLVDSFLVVTRTVTNSLGAVTTAYPFTNRYAPTGNQTVTIAGSKTWENGSLDPRQHPKSITVVLNANGVKVTQKQISASDNWSWSFTMDRFDAQGNEIVYSIDELNVPTNYTKTINGYNITNTYIEPRPTTPTSPAGPKTGDDSKAALFGLLFNAAGIVAVLCIWFLIAGKRRKRDTEEKCDRGESEIRSRGSF